MSAIFSIYGRAETIKLLSEYEGQALQNRLRVGARAGGGVFRAELRAEASSRSDLPHSFAKTKTNTTTRGGASGREIEVRVRPKSPLFAIFEEGAGSHTIGGGVSTQVGAGGRSRKVRGGRRTGGRLAGPAGTSTWDPGGRKRPHAFFARGPVRHPGFRARPLLAPVFTTALPRAETAIAEAIFGTTTAAPIGAG